MDMSDEGRLTSHLGLAKSIAYDFFLKRDQSIALDEVQSEAILGLLKAHDSFDRSRNVTFGAFAKTVIQNHLRDFFKRLKLHSSIIESAHSQKSPTETETEFFSNLIPIDQIDPSRESYRNEVRKALAEGLSQLGENQRNVMELVSQGYSFSEIAEKLSISKQAAQQAAQRAKENLKNSLQCSGIDNVLFCPSNRSISKSEDEMDLQEILKLPNQEFSPYVKTLLEAVILPSSFESRYEVIASDFKIPVMEIEETVKLAVKKARFQGHILFSDRQKIARQENDLREKLRLEEIRRREKRLLIGFLIGCTALLVLVVLKKFF